MNWQAIRTIVRKDLEVVSQSKPVLLPLIIVPVIMLMIMPAAVALVPNIAGAISPLAGLDTFLANMPPALRAELAGYDEGQKVVVLGVVYFLAPMYLIVPLMVSSVIAADSFAGEKERKTLEALIYTPTTDGELFLAKVLSAWLPALAIGWAGFLVYGIVANAAAWPVMQRIFFPNVMWVVLAVWVAPAVAVLGLGATVLVSARVRTFQEAYQMGGLVVLPVIALLVGQATGLMYLSTTAVAILGLAVWLVGALLIWVGARLFRRTEMITRL